MLRPPKSLFIILTVALMTLHLSISPCFSEENLSKEETFLELYKLKLLASHPNKVVQNAKSGNPHAQLILGMMYTVGMNVPKDYSEALKWYKLAAEQGNADAQYLTGNLYENGNVFSEARKWYQQAASQGNQQAQFRLYILLVTGRGGNQDIQEALKWLSLSARQGYADAQYKLGVHHILGLGVSKDYEQARKWLALSAMQGNEKAEESLNQLRNLESHQSNQSDIQPLVPVSTPQKPEPAPKNFNCFTTDYGGGIGTSNCYGY